MHPIMTEMMFRARCDIYSKLRDGGMSHDEADVAASGGMRALATERWDTEAAAGVTLFCRHFPIRATRS